MNHKISCREQPPLATSQAYMQGLMHDTNKHIDTKGAGAGAPYATLPTQRRMHAGPFQGSLRMRRPLTACRCFASTTCLLVSTARGAAGQGVLPV